MARRTWPILAGLLTLLALSVAARLLVGGAGDTPEQTSVLLEFRATRAVTGVVVGTALAIAGVMLQSLLRNPLASPDLLGLGSGAGLGVMVAMYLAVQAGKDVAGLGYQTPAAMVGALGALCLVYLLSQRRGLLDPTALVLVGVVIALVCAAGIDLVRHLLPNQRFDTARLLLGALRDDVTVRQVAVIGGLVGVAFVVGLASASAMDAAAIGEDEARSVGVPLGPLRATLFVSSGVLAAAAVLLAGPIGFIGLVAPHVARMLLGPSHRPLLIGAACVGASLVVLADAAIRVLHVAGGRLPIGVLTSLLGGPIFISMLRARHRGAL